LVVNSLQGSKTKFVSVRFGNVLGSNGSVIPIFKQQIASGGPVTITHPDMRRYFMTIPEAAQLVLQASAMSNGGEIFVLDMGKPIRIVDLATDLILLSGLRPGHDIEVEFTGVRPGEKLYEELNLVEEETLATYHDKIKIFAQLPVCREEMAARVASLANLCVMRDLSGIALQLKKLVPEYNPSHQILEACFAKQIRHGYSADITLRALEIASESAVLTTQ
jgi:FlaA1/EpsC-like NDP-sugar epimerase